MFDDFYGLTGRPFQLTPDPAFYFQSGTHRKALSYLSYGLAQSEGFMVITGEVGAGKSTLVAHLVATIDPELLSIGQVVTSKLDESEIIHVVAQSFGLEIAGHDKASALGAIEAFFHDEARAGRRCLLIVDESQNLTVDALEELRMLSNFQLGSHPLLQTLLLGQPEFRVTLQTHIGLEQLRQRVIAAHHLDPMEAAEVEPYILHRLRQVDWQGNPAFDQRVFTEMFKASGGIPRKVNQIASRLLLLGAVEQRSRIDAAMLQTVVDELDSDNAFPAAAPAPMAKVDAATGPESSLAEPVAAEQVSPDLEVSAMQRTIDTAALDPALVESALAERDTQIAELQQAVIELSNIRDEANLAIERPDITAMQERIGQMESQLLEQEQVMRHTLTMLIEWIEGDGTSQIAA